MGGGVSGDGWMRGRSSRGEQARLWHPAASPAACSPAGHGPHAAQQGLLLPRGRREAQGAAGARARGPCAGIHPVRPYAGLGPRLSPPAASWSALLARPLLGPAHAIWLHDFSCMITIPFAPAAIAAAPSEPSALCTAPYFIHSPCLLDISGKVNAAGAVG